MNRLAVLHPPAIGGGDIGQFADRIRADLAAKLDVIGPIGTGIVPDLVIGQIEAAPILGPNMGRPRPAIAAPAEDRQLIGFDAAMIGDLIGRVDGGDAPAKDRQAIGNLLVDAGIDLRQIANGGDVARLGDDGKACAFVEQLHDMDERGARTITRLRPSNHLLRRGADLRLRHRRLGGRGSNMEDRFDPLAVQQIAA